MAANEQKIRLRVAGRVYEMKIAPEKEEIYRLAEKQVNANVGKLQKAYGESVSAQDCLAITSLMFAIDNIAIARQNQLSDEDMKALDDLSQKLDSTSTAYPPLRAKAQNNSSARGQQGAARS